jgi:hypothetical protein
VDFGTPFGQLGHRGRALLDARRLAVPVAQSLHEGDALALGGGRDDHGRAARVRARGRERVDERAYAVAVAREHVPAEGCELGADVAEGHDLGGRAVDL